MTEGFPLPVEVWIVCAVREPFSGRLDFYCRTAFTWKEMMVLCEAAIDLAGKLYAIIYVRKSAQSCEVRDITENVMHAQLRHPVERAAKLAQPYEEPPELSWARDKLTENPGHTLTHFCNALLHADDQNFDLMRMAAIGLMIKYPLRRKDNNDPSVRSGV